MSRLRYWKPWRRVVSRLSDALAWWPWAEDKLLDYLFPSDCVVRFKGDDK